MNSSVTVAALVVSYNRRELLEDVILALRDQSRPVDTLIVVDNGSTDGSREYLKGLSDQDVIVLIEAGANIGGAGGFATGIAWASHIGVDHVWLMDDDAVPDKACLETLLDVVDEDVAFVMPQVLGPDGKTGPRNYPLLSSDVPGQYESALRGLIKVVTSTFVGPLLSMRAVRQTYLPLSDFFIWHDDVEYTARLSQLGDAYAVPTAKITHLAKNPGPSHYNGERNLQNIRNYIWWYREVKRNGTFDRRRILLALLRNVKSQFKNAPKKLSYLRVVGKAVVQGLRRRPAHHSIDQMLQISRDRDSLQNLS